LIRFDRGGVECRHAAQNAREPGALLMEGTQSGNPERSGHYLTVRR